MQRKLIKKLFSKKGRNKNSRRGKFDE